MRTSTWPSRGTSVFTAPSTEKVPLPCIGTQTCVSRPLTIAVSRSRTRAVTALKLASHEPQSRSIAALVVSEVVNGPGVSRMGSRSELLIDYLRGRRSDSHRLSPCLRACQQQARDHCVENAYR